MLRFVSLVCGALLALAAADARAQGTIHPVELSLHRTHQVETETALKPGKDVLTTRELIAMCLGVEKPLSTTKLYLQIACSEPNDNGLTIIDDVEGIYVPIGSLSFDMGRTILTTRQDQIRNVTAPYTASFECDAIVAQWNGVMDVSLAPVGETMCISTMNGKGTGNGSGPWGFLVDDGSNMKVKRPVQLNPL